MKLHEAIESGLPHRRSGDNFVYFVPHVGGIGYSQEDVMANDWIVGSGKSLIPKRQPEKQVQVLSFMDKIKKKLGVK
jgi:hypothetical protein